MFEYKKEGRIDMPLCSACGFNSPNEETESKFCGHCGQPFGPKINGPTQRSDENIPVNQSSHGWSSSPDVESVPTYPDSGNWLAAPSYGSIPPPPPPQSPMSSTLYATPGSGVAFMTEPAQSGKSYPRPHHKRRFLFFALVLILCIGLIVLGAVIYPYVLAPHPQPSGAHSQAVVHTTPAATLAPAVSPTEGVTATPSLTPTSPAAFLPKNPKLPLSIPCSQCNYAALTVTLASIAPDSSDQGTDWSLNMVDSGSANCTNASFLTAQITDPQGTQYTVDSNNYWSMNAGTSIMESLHFPNLLPQPAVTYTLNITITSSCTYLNSVNYQNEYQTENLTF
jgi:hypothetical protein